MSRALHYDALRKPLSIPEYDPTLVWATLLLLALGLVMVYSASIAIAEAARYTGQNPQFFLVRHATFLLVALAAAAVAFQVPVGAWQRSAPWLFIAGVALLVAVLIPGVGREVNGAQRWIPVGFANVQPSEPVKLFVVLYAADYAVRKAAHLDDLARGFLPMLLVMLSVGVLLLMQPDFGAFAVVATLAMGILFLGGMNWKLFAGLAALLAAGFVALIVAAPYRLQRVTSFLRPWDDPFGAGYQLSHALIAFGRGEWFGVGLGASVEKLFYLPEAHTDFLLAVIAEELGFAGVLAIVLLFAFLVTRAFSIATLAARLDRRFAALVAQGVGIWIGVQAIINMGVNMGVLPTKGLTLPLLSFGGSALVVTCVALAVLLRVDYENRRVLRGAPA